MYSCHFQHPERSQLWQLWPEAAGMQQRASPGVSWTAGWEFGSESRLEKMGVIFWVKPEQKGVIKMVIYNMFSMKFDDLTDLSGLSSNILKSFQGLQHGTIPTFQWLSWIWMVSSCASVCPSPTPKVCQILFIFLVFLFCVFYVVVERVLELSSAPSQDRSNFNGCRTVEPPHLPGQRLVA